MGEKVVVSTRIKKSIADDLQRVAKKQGISKTAVITLAVTDYIAKVDKKKRKVE